MPGGESGGLEVPGGEPDVPAGLRFRHSLGWFDIAVPPGWRLTEGEDPVRVVGPRDEAVAAISVAKTGSVQLPRARTRFLRRRLPGLSLVRHLHSGEGTRDGLSWARRDDLVGDRLPWYRRLVSRPSPRLVVVTACFTRGSLLALLTFEIEHDVYERHELMVGAMIGSLRLVEDPAPSSKEFVDRFLVSARIRFPSRRFQSTGEPLGVLVDGAELSLEQAYRALVCDPELQDEAFASVFRYLGAHPIPPPGSEMFTDVEERVLPSIKPLEWVRSANEKLPERHRVMWIPFPNETAVVFVVDYEAAMRFVSRDDAERWEVPPKQMLQVARQNLQARNEDPKEHVIVTEEGVAHAVALAEGDGYDAARLLLPGLRDRLCEHFGPDFAVAIPNRDFLIAFRTDKRGVLDHMRKLIERDSSRRPYPITDAFFRLTDEGIAAFED